MGCGARVDAGADQGAIGGDQIGPAGRPCAGGIAHTVVLCYHRVLPLITDDPYGLVVTAARFEEQLDTLAGWARFIGPDELAATDPPGSKTRVLVTLDDGYRDNIDYAFPILSARRIPSVLFAATGAIDRSVPFWWEVVAQAVRAGCAVPLDAQSSWRFLAPAERAARVGEVAAALARSDRDAVAALAADWGELLSVVAEGLVTLGAHTHAHSSLGRLSTALIREDVAASRQAIAARTGTPPRLFAYPHGSVDDLSIAAIDELQRQGFDFAFTTAGTAIAHALVPGSRAALTAPRVVVGNESGAELSRRLSELVSPGAAPTVGQGVTARVGRQRGRPAIAVLSGISAHNVGDDAMLVSTVQELVTLCPDADIRVLAETPASCRTLERQLGVPILRSPHDYIQRVVGGRAPGVEAADAVFAAATAIAVRHDVTRAADAHALGLTADECEGLDWLLAADGVIDCGGANLDQHWMDYFYEKCFDYLVAPKPLVVTGQGISRVASPADRNLLRIALDRAEWVTVRDHLSEAHLRETGCTAAISLAGDDVLALEPAPGPVVDAILRDLSIEPGGPFVAFQYRRCPEYDGPHWETRFAEIVDAIGDAQGIPIVGVPMHFGACDERRHLEAVARRTSRATLRVIQHELSGPEALGVFARASGACGISYHSAVFCLMSGTPFVGLHRGEHYGQKFEGLSRMYALPRLALALDDVGAGEVADALVAAMANGPASRAHLAARHVELLESTRRPRRALAGAVSRLAHAGGPAAPAVDWGALRRREPVSAEWGFDRGQPVDRYYIELFLGAHAHRIRGAVCELLNDDYTRQFGGDRVTHSDILDIDPANSRATIVGDLTHPTTLPIERFDCVILTQTLPYIFDCGAALAHAYAATRPGGTMLVTVPSIIRYHQEPEDHWRFTTDSLSRLVREHCPGARLTVVSYGNLISAVAFLYGMASGELSPFELESLDSRYALVIAACIEKGPSA